MNKIVATAALTIAALLFAGADSAQAQGVYNGYIGGGVYGNGVFGGLGGFGGSPYASGRIPTPPYFALHPPVYYSFPPVPRSYGYSPFAYPGSVRTPDVVVAPKPAEVKNPHIESTNGKPKAMKAPLNLTKRIEPAIIDNPFVSHRVANKD